MVVVVVVVVVVDVYILVFQLTHNKGHLQCTIEQHVLKHMWGDEKLIAKAKMHRKLGFF